MIFFSFILLLLVALFMGLEFQNVLSEKQEKVTEQKVLKNEVAPKGIKIGSIVV